MVSHPAVASYHENGKGKTDTEDDAVADALAKGRADCGGHCASELSSFKWISFANEKAMGIESKLSRLKGRRWSQCWIAKATSSEMVGSVRIKYLTASIDHYVSRTTDPSLPNVQGSELRSHLMSSHWPDPTSQDKVLHPAVVKRSLTVSWWPWGWSKHGRRPIRPPR